MFIEVFDLEVGEIKMINRNEIESYWPNSLNPNDSYIKTRTTVLSVAQSYSDITRLIIRSLEGEIVFGGGSDTASFRRNT